MDLVHVRRDQPHHPGLFSQSTHAPACLGPHRSTGGAGEVELRMDVSHPLIISRL